MKNKIIKCKSCKKDIKVKKGLGITILVLVTLLIAVAIEIPIFYFIHDEIAGILSIFVVMLIIVIMYFFMPYFCKFDKMDDENNN